MGPHSTSTKEERPAAEVERFVDFDPILIYQGRLRAAGLLNDESWAHMQAEVNAEMDEAEKFVEAAPWPDVEAAVHDV
jgi:TPP-dependent pyruvate/acetoin dehydrogenase alpha subunit